MSQFVFILSSLERIKVQVGDVSDTLPQRFIGEPGGSAVWGKLKMSIKGIRKRGTRQIAVEHSSAKGQFIFVCCINFLLRLLFSSSPLTCVPSPFLSIAFLRLRDASSLRSILVSSLKTVNSGRHQGECELARLSYPRR